MLSGGLRIALLFSQVTAMNIKTGESKTTRKGLKWVKVTHRGRNEYVVAFGFRGTLKAERTQSGSKAWAQVSARNFLLDQ